MATVSVRFWSSFSKRKNSTKQPSASPTRTHDCYLKDDCSIEEPIFCLKIDSGVDPSAYTYCQAFGNYYYITTREYSPPHWNLYCNLDAMATFKSAIGASSLYVLRSYSGFWNDRLVDSVPVMCNTVNDVVRRNGDVSVPFPNQEGCYVVTLLAQMGQNGDGAEHHVLTPAQYKTFSKNFYKTNAWQDAGGVVAAISPDTKALMQPENYIKDVRWYPFPASEIYSSSSTHHIYINGWDTNCEGYLLQAGKIVHGGNVFTLPKHPQYLTLGQYLNTSGFCQFTLYDPFAGTFNVDANSIASANQIYTEYYIDPSCGQGLYFATAQASGGNEDALIVASSMEFGVPVMFTSRTSGSLVSAVSELASGSPLRALGALYTTQVNPKLQTVGSIASKASYRQPPYLYCQYNEIVPIDRSLVGYPCCQTVQLSTIPGFIQCQTGDINVSCAPEYKAEIKAYLEGGFFYE